MANNSQKYAFMMIIILLFRADSEILKFLFPPYSFNVIHNENLVHSEKKSNHKPYEWPELLEKRQPTIYAQDPLIDFDIGSEGHSRVIKVSGLLNHEE